MGFQRPSAFGGVWGKAPCLLNRVLHDVRCVFNSRKKAILPSEQLDFCALKKVGIGEVRQVGGDAEGWEGLDGVGGVVAEARLVGVVDGDKDAGEGVQGFVALYCCRSGQAGEGGFEDLDGGA